MKPIFVTQPTFSFPCFLVSSGVVIRGGLLFSSTENKQSSKSGRNAVVLFVCELQVAVLKSPDHSRPFLLSDPVICSLLPPHAPTFPLLSLSLCCFCLSSVPFFFVSRYSVSVTHFLPLYQELIP